MDEQSDNFPFPNEILYKITACVISQSVHSIYLATTDTNTDWEMDVIATLCNVSRKVRAVTLHLAHLALNIEDSGKELYSQVSFANNQLQHLRRMVMDSYHALESPYSYEPRGGDGILATGYVLLLFVSVLRLANSRDAVQPSSARYTSVATTLQKAVRNCKKIPDFGVLDLLLDATQDEIDCTWLGLTIVQLAVSLDQLCQRWDLVGQGVSDENIQEKQDELMRELISTLDKTVAIGKQYNLIQEKTRVAVPILQLPGTLSTITDLERKFALNVVEVAEKLENIYRLDPSLNMVDASTP